MNRTEEIPLAVQDQNYIDVHHWLRKHYGRAKRCTNDPTHTKRNYQWANIDGIYDFDIKHFTQLCISCHRKRDVRSSTRAKYSAFHKGRPKYDNRVKVAQYSKSGELIETYSALFIATEKTGVSRTAIVNNLKERSKSAGGFIWRYHNE